MKKLFLTVVLLAGFVSNAQDDGMNVSETAKKNELTLNFLDLVAAGSVNVGYERFLHGNQSIAFNALLFDTFAYYDVGDIDKNTAMSAKLAYNLYFSKKKQYAGLYFYPFAKLRTGTITVDYEYWEVVGENVVNDSREKYDLSGFALGFGIGHKWVLANKFSLGLFVEIARTLGSYDEYYLDAVEFKAGVSFGYRF